VYLILDPLAIISFGHFRNIFDQEACQGISFVLSVLVTYLSIQYNLGYNVDLTLLSIAIIFPLVFNIRGAFRRREKALEHLSQ